MSARPLLVDLATGNISPGSVNGHPLNIPAGTKIDGSTIPTFSLGDARWVQLANLNSLGDARWSLLGHTHTFASLTSKPTTLAGYAISDAQPLDPDLTALAALATDPFGRALLTKADAASIRTYIGAGTSSFDGTFSSLTGKPTTIAGYGITDLNSLGDARWSLLAHTHTFASLTGKPTTISGYGITDAFTQAAADALYSPLGHTHTFSSLTSKPTTISGYGITDFNSLGDARWATIAQGVTTLSLATPSVIYSTPVTFTNTSGAWSGTLSLLTQAANRVFAGPTTGSAAAPAFRSLVAADIPDLSATYQPLDSDLTIYAGITPSANVQTLLGSANFAAFRTSLGVEPALGNPGTNGYVLSSTTAGVRSWVAQAGSVATDVIFDAKGDLPVGTGADTAAKLTVGANDTIAIADSSQTTGIRWGTPSSIRTALGLVIGTNVQAWSANLAAWSAIATSVKAASGANTDITSLSLNETSGVPLTIVTGGSDSSIVRYGGTPGMEFRRANGTIGSPTAVASGDSLGSWTVRGWDGASALKASRIDFGVSAAVSTGIVPGYIAFQTTDTSGVTAERARIDHAGNFNYVKATANTFAYFDANKNLVSAVAGTNYIAVTGTPTAGQVPIASSGTAAAWGTLAEAQLAFTDITTGNVSSTLHGFVPKSPADATKFLNGAATPAFALVKDSDLSTSDVTTNNVSTSKHGFAPKLPNDATKYLDGTGAYTVPAGGGTVIPGICQGRLTTESGVAISPSDRTAQSTLYFTPFNGSHVSLYTGSAWADYSFTERSLALSALTSGKNYDVFLYDNSGTLTLELSAAWTNDTTRADAIAQQDGVDVKSSAHTRLLVGTIRTTGTTTTEDSGGGTTTQVGGKRFVANKYNKTPRRLSVIDTTDSWAYTTDTWRQANGASGNKVEFVCVESVVTSAQISGDVYLSSNVARLAKVGVGIDSTTAVSGFVQGAYSGGAVYIAINGNYSGRLAAGYHYVSWNERGADGTCSFIGDNGADGTQTGLNVTIEN